MTQNKINFRKTERFKIQMSRKKLIRHTQILDYLLVNPSLRVNQLAEKLKVSVETIRRDLSELDKQGKIQRTYGGVISIHKPFEPVLSERLIQYPKERQRIAQAAYNLINKYNVILIGGGATTLHLIYELKKRKEPLTILTPAVHICAELSSNPLIEILLLPGLYDHKEGIVLGSETIEYIKNYKVPLAILGASGITEEGTSDAMLKAAQLYKAIQNSAFQTIYLADHSKVGKRALSLVSTWQDNITLITDRPLPESIQHACDTAKTKIIVAS